jgi:regulatory protein
MVHFEPKDEGDEGLAIVSYLPGAVPAGTRQGTGSSTGSSAGADGAAGASDEWVSDQGPHRDEAEQVLLERLRGRSLSNSEARAVLAGLELDDGATREIIERFTLLGYLDEARLAEQIVYSQHERKGLGRSGVQAELRRRGIDAELVEQTLDTLPDDEVERAIEVAVKRVQQLARLDDHTIDRRLNAFLMRKGYPSSVVREAVKAALASRGGGAAPGVRFR